jgi:NADPH:quinone reductase-like Zn-dependent oxidoreductase
MKAAIIMDAGQNPVYGDFRDPVAELGTTLIHVTASSISHVTRGRASGRHYSSSSTHGFIPGIDGTGVTSDGKRVYFLLPEAPYGAMAELSVVDERHTVKLPDGLRDEDAAAMAIPGMSSWAALVERAKLRAGETVLINGATGTSGRLAIQIARHLGASRVIATGRNASSFDDLHALGADVTIQLTQDSEALGKAFMKEFERGVDIVLDYLWGASAEALIVAAARAGADGVPIRYIEIGSMSGAEITLPSAALRSSALELMGSGIGSVPFPKLLSAVEGVLTNAIAAGFKVATKTIPLADVNRAWSDESADRRVVLVP